MAKKDEEKSRLCIFVIYVKIWSLSGKLLYIYKGKALNQCKQHILITIEVTIYSY
jgi:hypothetical protein